MIKLVRGELLKVRTTNLWWIFLILMVVFTGLAFAVAALQAHQYLNESMPHLAGMSPARAQQFREQWEAQRNVPGQAASLYTAGQFFGLLFVMILGALVITNEFFHQTATTTFLATPKRTRVVLSKLSTAVAIGAQFWLVATLLDVIGGVIFMQAEAFGPQFDHWVVWRAVLLNLLGYAIWTVVGFGLGVLVRSQIATVILGIVIYFATGGIAQTIAQVLDATLNWHWALKAVVVLPATASSLMIEGTKLPGNPPQWVGAVVLVGWGVLAGLVGTALTRRRDVT
jgi:ABC-2 type transport system permease protein